MRLPPRPPLLAGREALLTQLDARLSAGDGLTPRTVALYGLGGAGKTSVAVEYANRHLAEVGVAWQFAAEDSTVLAAGFGELAAQLGVRGLADTRDPVASVHAVLARYAAPWLLIFDNAADMASVETFLPPAGPGRVLITSQNPAWPGQPLDVPGLDRGVAAGFLVSRTGDPDSRAALDLADRLGGLPLALEQAAAYVQATGNTLAAYLALFLQRRAEMLARGEPTGYRGTVASTWALAFDRLQHTAPGAVGLLRLLAFCASEAVPLRLLLQPRPGLAGPGDDVATVLVPLLEDPLAAGDAIAALRRYSLVTPAAGASVSVHRLVQAVTADQMHAELARAWQQAAAAVIEAAIPQDPQQPANWPVFRAILPHAEAALPADSVGMVRIAEYLGASAKARGIATSYRNYCDREVQVAPDTIKAILAALGDPPSAALRASRGSAAAAVSAPQPRRRSWGLTIQLYAVRSRASWGHGDFRDLADLAAWSGRALCAGFVLINPLHAAEPVPPISPSPYLPMSRRQLSPLYLRIEDILEYRALSPDDRARIDALAAPLRAASATGP